MIHNKIIMQLMILYDKQSVLKKKKRNKKLIMKNILSIIEEVKIDIKAKYDVNRIIIIVSLSNRTGG